MQKNVELDGKLIDELNSLAKKEKHSIDKFIRELIANYNKHHERNSRIEAELKFYKERELEALTIGDAIYDGIYIIDKNGIVIAVNKIFLQLTGLLSEEVIGKHIKVLIKEEILTNTCCLEALKQKEKVSTIVTTKDNKNMLVTSNPIFDSKQEVTQVLSVLRDLTELNRLKKQLQYSEEVSKRYLTELEYLRNKQLPIRDLIGKSKAMIQIKELIYQVAKVDATVLINGETGVGKEVVAREIYKHSNRVNSPYVKVNCAAIPENLLESELFGYEKGAFTGAQYKEKLGFFEIANTGTILLDEIGELPINLQSKLLRVIQERELVRLGGTKPIKLDIRVIAVTNKNLEEQVKIGAFREDLFYRLNVIPIYIPPLRLRKEDIALLASHFINKCNEKYNLEKTFDLSAIKLFEQYDWPGNVRELENIIERLIVVINDSVIKENHVRKMIDIKLKDSFSISSNKSSLKDALMQFEKQIIEKALEVHGSTHKAARALGVSQPTVLRKAKKLGIKK